MTSKIRVLAEKLLTGSKSYIVFQKGRKIPPFVSKSPSVLVYDNISRKWLPSEDLKNYMDKYNISLEFIYEFFGITDILKNNELLGTYNGVKVYSSKIEFRVPWKVANTPSQKLNSLEDGYKNTKNANYREHPWASRKDEGDYLPSIYELAWLFSIDTTFYWNKNYGIYLSSTEASADKAFAIKVTRNSFTKVEVFKTEEHTARLVNRGK